MVTTFSLFLSREKTHTLPLSTSEPESRQGMTFINQTCGVWERLQPEPPAPTVDFHYRPSIVGGPELHEGNAGRKRVL